MKPTTKITHSLLILCCSSMLACSPEFDKPVDANLNSGTTDVSNYVAVGDSLTAGYADDSLYLHGQEKSLPAILAQQFARVGGGTFNQPLVADNNGGLLLGGTQIADTRYILSGTSTDDLSPVRLNASPSTEIAVPLMDNPYNNMGVPGAKSFHLGLSGYGDLSGVLGGTANPYYVRFASASDATVITDAAGQLPSFFTLWIGNNDVLGFATSGGTGSDQTGNLDPTTYGSTDITDPNVFASVYAQLIAALQVAGGKGVLLGIPDVSSIPFFTTVPYNAVPLDQDTADTLNAAYAAYNAGLISMRDNGFIDQTEVDARTISFAAGANAVVIEDEDLTDLSGFGLPSMRQATADDLLVLTTSAKIGTLADEADATSAWGIGVPLEDADVLIASERASIATATTAFNATIEALAAADPDNLVFLDIAAVLDELNATGINFGSGTVFSTFVTGGAFSLDGVHLTARGYAIIANRVIASINEQFDANVPFVDPIDYTTIFFE